MVLFVLTTKVDLKQSLTKLVDEMSRWVRRVSGDVTTEGVESLGCLRQDEVKRESSEMIKRGCTNISG